MSPRHGAGRPGGAGGRAVCRAVALRPVSRDGGDHPLETFGCVLSQSAMYKLPAEQGHAGGYSNRAWCWGHHRRRACRSVFRHGGDHPLRPSGCGCWKRRRCTGYRRGPRPRRPGRRIERWCGTVVAAVAVPPVPATVVITPLETCGRNSYQRRRCTGAA